MLQEQVNFQNVQNTRWSKFFKFSKASKFLKSSKLKSCQITILKYSYDTKLHFLIVLWKFKDKNENARTKMKMQGQKGKCKDDIKSYFLDHFEQSKTKGSLYTQVLLSSVHLLALVEFVAEVYGQGYIHFLAVCRCCFLQNHPKIQIKKNRFVFVF